MPSIVWTLHFNGGSVLVPPTHGPVSCSSESGLLPVTREIGTSQAEFQHMIIQHCSKETLHHVWQVKYLNEH